MTPTYHHHQHPTRRTVPRSRSVAAPAPLLVRRPPSRSIDTSTYRQTFSAEFRGLYRVFNAAGYRFFRSQIGPPANTDTPFATNSTLAFTPDVAWADGTWYVSVSYFNGVVDSDFLPLGPNGQTWLTLTISGGTPVLAPPPGPSFWQCESTAGGVIQVTAMDGNGPTGRGAAWALNYTTDGSTPAAGAPAILAPFTGSGPQIWSYGLPEQLNGTVVEVLLQTARNDGTDLVPSWSYSSNPQVVTITAIAAGPAAPLGAATWPGELPESEEGT